MGDLLIRNVSEAMKRNISERADRHGRSLSEEAKQLIGKAIMADDEPAGEVMLSGWDRLRAILAPDDATEAEAYATIVAEIEADRKQDFGRPVPDFE